MLIAIAYTVTWLPFKVAFFTEDSNTPEFTEEIVEILFGIDLLVNFTSEYEDPITLKPISCYKKIAKNYISTWFILDFLAFFPF